MAEITMADEAQLIDALRRADAAGDEEAAKAIARRIQSMRSDRPTAKPKESAQALYQRAQSGDADAKAQYNARAQAAGQNTIEQDRAAYNPTTGNNFLAGVGKSFVDTGRGIKQIFGGYTPEEVEEQRRLDAPLMDTTGGVVGNAVGAGAQLMIPGGQAKLLSMAPKALAGVAPYALAGAQAAGFAGLQPVGVDESRAGNTAAGGAWGVGGQVVGSQAGRVAGWLTPKIDDAISDLVDYGRTIGVNPSLGQISQNPMVRQITNQLGRFPFSGQGARNAANQDAVNAAVGSTYGVQGSKITPTAHAKARNALSAEFDRLKAQNEIVVDPMFIGRLQQVRADVARDVGSDGAALVDGWIEKLLNKSKNGKISGVDYGEFDSQIGKLAKTGGLPGHGLGMLRDTVREVMDANISPKDAKAWQAVRAGWANMKTVEPLVAKSTTGDIPAAQLMGRVTADNAGKVRMASGKGGKLGEVAKVGQQFLKEPADSGTAGRLMAMQFLSNPITHAAGLGGAAYGAEQAGWVSPGQLGTLAALLALNRGGLKLANSPSLISGSYQRGLARAVEKTAPKALPAFALTGAKPLTEEEKKKLKKKP